MVRDGYIPGLPRPVTEAADILSVPGPGIRIHRKGNQEIQE